MIIATRAICFVRRFIVVFVFFFFCYFIIILIVHKGISSVFRTIVPFVVKVNLRIAFVVIIIERYVFIAISSEITIKFLTKSV